MKKILLIVIAIINFSCNSQTKEQKIGNVKSDSKTLTEKIKSENDSNTQEKITKEIVQEYTKNLFKENQIAAAVEMKIANDKVFIRVQTKDEEKKENFLLITSEDNILNQNFEKVEIIKMNFTSVLGNYIKKYYNDKRNSESEKN